MTGELTCKAASLHVRTLAVVAVLAGGLVGLLVLVGPWFTPAAPTPAAAPAPTRGLFSPAAVLDTVQIDDLRAEPFGACLARQRVLTADGRCVEGVFIWPEEVDTESWNALRQLGYDRVNDPGVDRAALWVPAELVVLDDDTVIGVLL